MLDLPLFPPQMGFLTPCWTGLRVLLILQDGTGVCQQPRGALAIHEKL